MFLLTVLSSQTCGQGSTTFNARGVLTGVWCLLLRCCCGNGGGSVTNVFTMVIAGVTACQSWQ